MPFLLPKYQCPNTKNMVTDMSNPQSFNALTNVKFKFDIQRAPNVTYWMQSCILPTVQIEGGILPGMRRDVPIPGQKAEFENLVITFIVDQDLKNYEEIFNWFQDIASASTIDQMVANCSLHFLNGDNEVNRTIDFIGAYPTVMTELSLNSDDSDTVPVTCSVTFNYEYFKFANTKPVWSGQ